MESLAKNLKFNLKPACLPEVDKTDLNKSDNQVTDAVIPKFSEEISQNNERVSLVEKVSNFASCLSLLQPSHRIAVVQELSQAAPNCFSEELIPERHNKQSEQSCLKIHIDLGSLTTDYPAVYKQCYGFMKALLYFSRVMPMNITRKELHDPSPQIKDSVPLS